MLIKDTLTQSLGAISTQRLCAGLIILAMSIGIASVYLVPTRCVGMQLRRAAPRVTSKIRIVDGQLS